MPDQPIEGSALESLLASIDSQVRRAHVRAHTAVLMELAKLDDLTLGDVTIPAKALIPRDLPECTETAMEFDVYLSDKGVSLSQGFRLGFGGTKAKVAMKWEARSAPEATALVRTKAETILATEIQHG